MKRDEFSLKTNHLTDFYPMELMLMFYWGTVSPDGRREAVTLAPTTFNVGIDWVQSIVITSVSGFYMPESYFSY